MNVRHIVITALVLLLFAVLGTGLVAFTYDSTRGVIAANARAKLLRDLNTLVPSDRYDNALLNDTLGVRDPALLGTQEPVTVYRARKNGQPVAAILAPIAPDGYSGDIKLLVAINADGTLAGVRVTAHRETPGLGDAIEAARSDWILKFAGRSLADPDEKHWAVKKDGGVFDQFTGATITPRAVVKAVKKALIYFQRHRQSVFAGAQPPTAEAASP
ncbi:MAG: electron transport complex subunit RsxG [Gammaproteobacteria bacterium]|nr:electron transport complex subunit RsxG [Gammaproteobacteria bacterium]